MTVTEHVGNDQPDSRGAIDPLAAAELAQELNLVARSLFAQLLPSTATRALSGVPGLGMPDQEAQLEAPVVTPEPAAPVATEATPTPASVAPVAVPVVEPHVTVAVPVPVLSVADMPAATPDPAPAAAAAPVGIPVPTLSAPMPAAESPAVPHKPERLSLAMLEEIGFLDE